MSDEEPKQDPSFKDLAGEIDSPKFSALSLSVAAQLDFPSATQQLAENVDTLTGQIEDLRREINRLATLEYSTRTVSWRRHRISRDSKTYGGVTG